MKNYIIQESNYPTQLRFADSFEESQKRVINDLIIQSTRAEVLRVLEQEEIEAIRKEYTDLIEIDKCQAEEDLFTLLSKEDEIKLQVKAAKDRLGGIEQNIRDHVQTIKKGHREEDLSPEESFCVAIDGNNLHYTWDEDKYVLAKVDQIPQSKQGDIFTQQTKNQEVFIEMFGCQFSQSDQFEQVSIKPKTAKNLLGRKLASRALRFWMEDFADEDTGEIITIERHDIVLERDTVLDEDHIHALIEGKVESIVLYRETKE